MKFHLSNLILVLTVCAAGWLRAQDAAPTPVVVGDKPDTLIQLVNNPVADVLATYEQLTGKQVIKEGTLPDVTININVTEPVTRQEAVELIESALLLNGFTMMPGPGNSVKVVSVAGGRNPRSQGVKVFTAGDKMPEGEQVISYVMKLNFMTAAEAVPIFTQHFAPTPPYGSIVAVPSANALLMTESANVIRQMIKMQNLIDVPPVEVAANFVPMLRANADRVVATIGKIMNADGQSSGSSSSGDGGTTVSSKLSINFGQGNPVKFAADTRTNRVIVICNPAVFPYFEKFVQSFDVASDEPPTAEFKLRYVSVGDVLPALAATLREGRKKDSGDDDPLNQQNQQTTSTVQQYSSDQTTTTSTTSSGETNVLGSVQEKGDRVLPLTVTVGGARLIADQRNNTIIALAPPESLDRIRSVIEQLDKPTIQVYLSIVIMELDVTNNLEYGVDLYLHGDNGAIASNQRLGTVPNIRQLLNPDTAANFLASSQNTPGLALFGTFGQALDVLVTALESSGKTKVLGRPTVYTSNNKKAVISVGEQIPVPQSTISTVNPNQNNSTALTSTIDYKDVLLQLEVVPLINNDNEVTLEVAQKNDTLGQTFDIAGTQVQSVRTQQIKTSVTVPNKHTVVLGGLITDREEKVERKFPVLGDIPIVGLAFKGVSNKKQRKELVLMIQPQIVIDERALFTTDALEKRRARGMRDTQHFINPPLPENDDIPSEAELIPFETNKKKPKEPVVVTPLRD